MGKGGVGQGLRLVAVYLISYIHVESSVAELTIKLRYYQVTLLAIKLSYYHIKLLAVKFRSYQLR